MNDVVEINEIEALRSYHLAWTALHAETPRASFFQTLEWLESYWRYASDGQRLRVLIVRSNGRPIGILPLVERTEVTRLGSVRLLTYPLENWGSFFGPIGANQTATLALAMKHIASTPRTWDVFGPKWALHDTADRGCTEQAMRLAGLVPTVEPYAATSSIDFRAFPTWEAYLKSRSKKTRHELLRQRRQLQRDHTVEFVRYRPEALRRGGGDPGWELYNQCVAISEKSWQAASVDGNTLCNRSVAELLVDANGQAARLGMLDMSLLLIDGKPAAYYYGYHCNGEVVGLRTGYDPDAPSGAGSVLISHVIEDGLTRGDRRIDLGVGAQKYKKRLRTNVEKTWQLNHVAWAAWRPQALRAARWCAKRLQLAG